ncbi:MAG: hypothetical protein GY906_23805 [bacterium]|nr:hypothetical protein [bacterium]
MNEMRSNIEAHWDEFCDWLEDNCDIRPQDGHDTEEWEQWFNCWNAALDAREAEEQKDRENEI